MVYWCADACPWIVLNASKYYILLDLCILALLLLLVSAAWLSIRFYIEFLLNNGVGLLYLMSFFIMTNNLGFSLFEQLSYESRNCRDFWNPFAEVWYDSWILIWDSGDFAGDGLSSALLFITQLAIIFPYFTISSCFSIIDTDSSSFSYLFRRWFFGKMRFASSDVYTVTVFNFSIDSSSWFYKCWKSTLLTLSCCSLWQTFMSAFRSRIWPSSS